MHKLLLVLAVLISPLCFAQRHLLHCGHLINPEKEEILEQMTIVVEKGHVSEIIKGYLSPNEDDKVVNLREKYVLPGLIDMHVHLEHESNPNSYLEEFKLNEADIAFRSAVYAKKTLMAGFTTVRDLGGSGVNTALSKAIDQGLVMGPRVYSAGKAIASTGGHADPTNGYRKDLMGVPGPDQGVANGPDDCREAVRQRYKNGANCIKITATGGVLSVAKNSSNPQFTLEEIQAICETAKDYGFHVAAHAHGDEGMYRAVQGGVKTIEHGTLMSEKTMDLMKLKNAYLVPTITAGKEVTEKAEVDGYYPEVVVPKAKEIGPQIQGTFGKAYKRGVPIAFGTDAGVFPHGENGKEFFYMVEAGMPAMQALKAATYTNSQVLENNKIGRIKPGAFADIIAVSKNPLENIRTMESVDFVMKGGEIVKGN
ncbi:MAG: amidohydrolase family protein [Luteibaculum sp.]